MNYKLHKIICKPIKTCLNSIEDLTNCSSHFLGGLSNTSLYIGRGFGSKMQSALGPPKWPTIIKGLRRCRRPRHEGAGAAADVEETATSNPSLQSAGAALRCKQHGEEKALNPKP